MGKEKQPWFGKRWTKSAVSSLDGVIFGSGRDVEQISMASSFCHNFTLGLIGGFAIAILSLFVKGDTINEVVVPTLFGLSLLASVYFLWGTLRYFDSVWSKIGRSLYVVILNAIACGIGCFIGMWVGMIAIVLFVLWLVLQFWLSDGSKKSDTVTLQDGTELHRSGRGICGEQYWEDGEGRSYYEQGNGRFQKS